MPIDKSKMLDVSGRPLTQGLFLEINYNEDYAIYTLKDDDHEYNGRIYPSLKKLYLIEEDPTEYIFAEKHLLGWQHWKRIKENKVLGRHIAEWKEELDMKLMSAGIREMFSLVGSENGSFQAAKFLIERGWEKRGAGRPSKAEVEKQAAIAAHKENEFNADFVRLEDFRKN